MKEHQRLIKEADERQLKYINADAAKKQEIKAKGEQEREKLMQAIRKREEKERQEEQLTKLQLESLERKQERSLAVQRQENEKKALMAQQSNYRLNFTIERCKLVK